MVDRYKPESQKKYEHALFRLRWIQQNGNIVEVIIGPCVVRVVRWVSAFLLLLAHQLR
jgi:hypothetical protein